jgi:nudix-type nucleoside diphosphatase (YffH/AdpP family)
MRDATARKVVIHGKRRVFEDFFSVEEVNVSFEGRDGQMIGPMRRLSFERGDSVAALVLKRGPEPKVLLVEQFKYPVFAHDGGWIVETVAGMIDPAESPEAALERELEEELGFRTSRHEPIAAFYSSPGGSSERVYLFYCEVSESDAVPGAGGGMTAEGEDIQILEYGIDEFFDKLANGFFKDPKIIISGLWLRLRLPETPATP